MPRRVPYSAACALVPASLMAAPSPEAALEATAEEALLRAAVEAAIGSNPEVDGEADRLPISLKARRVGRVAHVQATLPDGQSASMLFRYDGRAWRRVSPAA